jgi:GrpB-like predicted nucleotidyltransferase (UPF0157 family)
MINNCMNYGADMSNLRKVLVVPWDASWPGSFAAEAGQIGLALSMTTGAIHHIGSTSITGMAAKPVIDILAVVPDIEKIDECSPFMVALGYVPMGEYGLPGRRFFLKDTAGIRSHHVHVYQRGNPEIHRHLAFRDFLRTHPKDAAAYSELKCKLAAAHPQDIAAYIDGKHDFIQVMEKRALQWAASAG